MNPTDVVALRQRMASRMFDDYDFETITMPDADSTGRPGTSSDQITGKQVTVAAAHVIRDDRVPSFLVADPIRDVVAQAADALPHLNVQSDEPLTEYGCLFFASPTRMQSASLRDRGVAVVDCHGFVWVDFDSSVAVTLLVRYPETDDASYPVPGPLMALSKGRDIDESTLGDQAVWARRVVALWRFMNQKLMLAGPPELVSRGLRREAERDGVVLPDIRVIRLRSVSAGAASDYPTDVEWSHRWIVRGHWRQQWHPGTAEHRLRWIDPYLKGPEDKPLVIRPTVYEVAR